MGHKRRMLDLGRLWCRVAFALNPLWRIEVTGLGNLDSSHPYVVVANHQSVGDILALIHLPLRMRFVAKWTLFAFVPLWGWQVFLMGHLPVRRGDRTSSGRLLARMARALELRQSVLLFPEGTRSETGDVASFKSGAFRIALRARVPILPVVVAGTRDAVPKGSLRFGRRAFVRMDVLPPVATDGLDPQDPKSVGVVRDRVRQAIVERKPVLDAEVARALAAWK